MTPAETLLRGASSAFVIRVAGAGFAFAMHILLARSMSVSDYGIYAYIVAWLNVLVLFSVQGFNSAAHRFVAQYQSKGELAVLGNFLRFTTVRVVVVSLLFSLGLFVFAGWFDFEESHFVLLLLMACMLPFLGLLRLLSGYFVGFKEITFALVPVELLRPMVIIVGLAVLSGGFAASIDVISAMQLTVAGTILALGLSGGFFVRSHSRSIWMTEREKPGKDQTTQWHRVAMPLFAMSVFGIALTQTDTIMIGMLVDTRAVGIYSIAWRIAALISFGIFAVTSIIAPMISELYHNDRLEELRQVLRLSSKILLVYAFFSAVFIALFGPSLLSIFGSEYEAALRILQLLLLYHVIQALAGPAAFLMTMTGHEVVVMKASGIAAAFNVVVNVLFIQWLGAIGAAYGTVITCLLFNCYLVFYMSRRHQLNPCVANLFGGSDSDN